MKRFLSSIISKLTIAIAPWCSGQIDLINLNQDLALRPLEPSTEVVCEVFSELPNSNPPGAISKYL